MGKSRRWTAEYFSRQDRVLWGLSVGLVTASFLLFDRESYLTLAASLTGVTSLIFNAKGNPAGQLLMVVFSLLYGLISYGFAYYGEMVTYLGMTAPVAVCALVSWLRNPYNGRRAEVKVGRLSAGELVFSLFLTAGVTLVFYYILKTFRTANLGLSTLSVSTSFFAAYLTYRRSVLFALAYAANDVVLVVLWCMAASTDRACFSVVICFLMFLANDLYGFFSWRAMGRRQESGEIK